MKCEICKGETSIRNVRLYHYKESGLDNVYLDNIDVQVCTSCDEESPFIPRILDLHGVIAREIALQPMPLRGQDMRFLRKQLGMRAKEWAGLLRVDAATLSRSENGARQIGPQSDLLVRFLYIRLSEEREGRMFSGNIAEKIAAICSQHVGTPNMVVDVNTMRAAWHPSLEDTVGRYEATMKEVEEDVVLTHQASQALPQGQLAKSKIPVSENAGRPTDTRGPSPSGKVMIQAA
jgi:YgiT-type zinc finger domain-containing protein